MFSTPALPHSISSRATLLPFLRVDTQFRGHGRGKEGPWRSDAQPGVEGDGDQFLVGSRVTQCGAGRSVISFLLWERRGEEEEGARPWLPLGHPVVTQNSGCGSRRSQ